MVGVVCHILGPPHQHNWLECDGSTLRLGRCRWGSIPYSQTFVRCAVVGYFIYRKITNLLQLFSNNSWGIGVNGSTSDFQSDGRGSNPLCPSMI